MKDQQKGMIGRFLDTIEWLGNRLPDPAIIFILAFFVTLLASAVLAQFSYELVDPRSISKRDEITKELLPAKNIEVVNLTSPTKLIGILTSMVDNFVKFPPLGVVLVALLGVGVAEHTGMIRVWIKIALEWTPNWAVTPMVVLLALLSHVGADSGYVLVIPLAGVVFAATGRHPIAGILVAFAGVSGGFSACLIPSGLDPMLQAFTQTAAQIVDPERTVNPLCNYIFLVVSAGLIVAVGWFLTETVTAKRLLQLPVDVPMTEQTAPPTPQERTAAKASMGTLIVLLIGLGLACWSNDSVFREPGTLSLTSSKAPLILSIVPLIFLLALIPSIVYGVLAGTVKDSRAIIEGMSKSMATMGHYLVMGFFAAQFIYVFNESNIGVLIAVQGATWLKEANLPLQILLLGMILLTTTINLLIGSASAKWALLSPIFIPMFLQLGMTPELIQAAYRVGDSSTNIITPLMPYFPLVVLYCQKYRKDFGVGTLISFMLPYSICFLLTWTLLLLLFWTLGAPLGLPMVWGSGGYQLEQ